MVDYKCLYEEAVSDIRSFCIGNYTERPTCNNCIKCKRFIKLTDKRRKYRYSCTEYCPDALDVMVKCGFTAWKPFIKYLRQWEPKDNMED